MCAPSPLAPTRLRRRRARRGHPAVRAGVPGPETGSWVARAERTHRDRHPRRLPQCLDKLWLWIRSPTHPDWPWINTGTPPSTRCRWASAPRQRGGRGRLPPHHAHPQVWDEPLAVQAELMAHYAPRFPSVTEHTSIEWSMLKQHLNWYGGALSLPPPTATPWKADTSVAAINAATQRIHDAGGVAAYNHPFGSGSGSQLSSSAQDSGRRRTGGRPAIGQRCYGATSWRWDIRSRAASGVLNGYLALWTRCPAMPSSSPAPASATTSAGGNWLTIATNFFTWAWARRPHVRR